MVVRARNTELWKKKVGKVTGGKEVTPGVTIGFLGCSEPLPILTCFHQVGMCLFLSHTIYKFSLGGKWILFRRLFK